MKVKSGVGVLICIVRLGETLIAGYGGPHWKATNGCGYTDDTYVTLVGFLQIPLPIRNLVLLIEAPLSHFNWLIIQSTINQVLVGCFIHRCAFLARNNRKRIQNVAFKA